MVVHVDNATGPTTNGVNIQKSLTNAVVTDSDKRQSPGPTVSTVISRFSIQKHFVQLTTYIKK